MRLSTNDIEFGIIVLAVVLVFIEFEISTMIVLFTLTIATRDNKKSIGPTRAFAKKQFIVSWSKRFSMAALPRRLSTYATSNKRRFSYATLRGNRKAEVLRRASIVVPFTAKGCKKVRFSAKPTTRRASVVVTYHKELVPRTLKTRLVYRRNACVGLGRWQEGCSPQTPQTPQTPQST
ncbi:hypothetical protein AKO1_008034 [Acrasis kona]|uniref:Uncharacterized protein n=1 Tax=Acrasis kona TaxID=1008807 RepID=A0AAW2YQ55_9EUKA